MSATRREWLAAAAGSLAAGCGGEPRMDSKTETAAAEVYGRMIDGHVHVWTSDTETYPIGVGRSKDEIQPSSFTPEELFAHSKPAGVNRINLIQMSFYEADHSYMLAAMEKYPEVFAGTGRLVDITSESARPAEIMRELAERRVYAFRLGGGTQGKPSNELWMEHPNYEAIYRTGAELNLAPSFLVNPTDLPEIGRMSERFPDTPVIIDHLARIGVGGEIRESDLDALCRLARHPRIIIKIGAFYALSALGPPYTDLLPMIQRVVEAFGAERCMWESDCPFQVESPHTYEASVALIRDHAKFLTPAEKEHIFVTTTAKFFFLR